MEIKWRKGHLRDENSASKCKWLELETQVPFRERAIAVSDIEIPGRERANTVTEVAGAPYIVLTCRAPELLGECQSDIPPTVRGKERIDKIQVTLEVCRHCPFWMKWA